MPWYNLMLQNLLKVATTTETETSKFLDPEKNMKNIAIMDDWHVQSIASSLWLLFVVIGLGGVAISLTMLIAKLPSSKGKRGEIKDGIVTKFIVLIALSSGVAILGIMLGIGQSFGKV